MYEPYNPYNLYGPYYNYNAQQIAQQQRQSQQMYKPQVVSGLQGKVVDSLDVVKATDIPYDRKRKLFSINR